MRLKKLLQIFLIVPMLMILIPIGGYLLLAFLTTLFAEKGELQREFSKGEVPDPLPKGLYNGEIFVKQNFWKGKTFYQNTYSGINNFSGHRERYPFTMYVAPGLRDRNKDVLKIYYDLPENPFWLRWILDEIVEVSPGKYLGKVHIRLVPFLPFTLGYFKLEKAK